MSVPMDTLVEQQNVLELRNLGKTFPGVSALRGVDLDIRRGEIHALVGQNGSGKSTLIKILAGLHSPDDGSEAWVNGRALTLGSSKAAHELGIRFVHQDLGLIDNLSGVDNMALGFGYATGRAGNIRWRAQRAATIEAIGHVVSDFPVDQLAGSMSVFQRTALAIARALQDWRANGSLLVLDEPTAAMPRSEVENLFAILRRIRDRGTPVLIVTHHLEEVFAVSDHVTVLRDGEVVTTTPAKELNTGTLVDLMTGGHGKKLARGGERTVGAVAISIRDMSGTIVDDFGMSVRSGEIVGVAGLDGSGREELCSLIFGASERSGEVTIGDKILPPKRPDLSVRLKLGLVPANRHRHGLVMTSSVRENLTLSTLGEFVRLGRVNRKGEKRAVRGEIGRFGIKTPSSEAVVASLSGGNQQKIVIAKWLRLNPSVLLLDEPTQGVDVAAQADLHELLIDAADNGTAILVCSSDELELSQICDRVLVMRKGRIVTELSRTEATAERIFESTIQVGTARHDALPSTPSTDRVSK